ncbi:MAG: 5-(carboxyamino)imidazole ribonucleotide synthase [Deltaproteobacteria bacterium]|nr:5-(carboxyamino)imidazole ribonucleotide synthase [Deltaproteobacteria bacterium]
MKKAPIIGIFGGGQLGRMSILAGRRLGLHFRVFEPKRGSSAAKVADEVVIGPYEDLQLVRQFATGLDVVTVEFENVPAAAMRCAAEVTAVRPSVQVLEIAQHRQREKTWLRDHGFPCAPFRVIEARSALEVALQALGLPAVLKTAAFGYDGKGQVKLTSADPATLDQAWAALGGQTAVLEAWIPHQGEVSVIGARSPTGEVAFYPLAENLHRNHILHQTIVPARVPAALEEEAQSLARALFEKIELVGLLAIELFIGPDGHLLVNELAPRPHNSGHHTLDANVTSQFEQHVRAVLGWPLGSTEGVRPAVMTNLLGDLWQGREPNFHRLLADPTVKLHLYDKGAPAVGRKMGHYTVLDPDPAAALFRANQHFEALSVS